MSGVMLRLFKCHHLTGKKDFEPWWALMEDLFYACGWLELWDAGQADLDPDDEEAVELYQPGALQEPLHEWLLSQRRQL